MLHGDKSDMSNSKVRQFERQLGMGAEGLQRMYVFSANSQQTPKGTGHTVTLQNRSPERWKGWFQALLWGMIGVFKEELEDQWKERVDGRGEEWEIHQNGNRLWGDL